MSKVLNDYASNQLNHLAYAVIGTFGVGKTQFLYHIHRLAMNRGIVPFYFIAEDLFREVIINNDKIFTPGDVFALVDGKVKGLKEALSEKNYDAVGKIVDPRGKLRNEASALVNLDVKDLSKADLSKLKVILLVDELEGQYGVLQSKVQTKDRSPLREWLEDKVYLKFLAFAPAGIYELGGADRDRVKRIVLPPSDIDYVREKLIKDPGRSNSCWWLSRGKARQLFKACEKLNSGDLCLDTTHVYRIIKDELDQIGQEPSQVPSAYTSAVEPSKVPFLLNLCPVSGESAKRYVIDTSSFDVGKLADRLVEAFSVNRDNAILISEYFLRTTKSLSGPDGVTYIEDRDLPELFYLVFDHILEYELGSPELSDKLGEMLNLYERVNKENPALYGIIGRLWELKETKLRLPLAINEIRRAFPFPSMNPIVKNYLPSEMSKKWEGKGLPIWRRVDGDITILFFASERDFVSYSDKDEFMSNVIPEGKSTLCVFPTGESLKQEKSILTWLRENKKLEFANLPHLLNNFLLSATGEIQEGIPGDLQLHLGNLKGNKQDILLSRKSEVYSEAINEIISSAPMKPETFDKGVPPDAGTVWGKGQMDRDVAVEGIALAFEELTVRERQVLAEMRELFRSGKEGRGSGDLNQLMPRGGYIALSDDILPRYSKKKEPKDSEPVERLKGYWREHERDRLVGLSRILSLEQFLKLHSQEDLNRLLEALWKSVRNDFNSGDMQIYLQKLEKDIYPILDDCWKLEQEVRALGSSGIAFKDKERLVKAKDGIEKLFGIGEEVLKDTGSAAPLVKFIVSTFMGVVVDNIEKDARNLASASQSARNALEELKRAGENLKKNFWEYPKATKFIGITDDGVKAIVSEQVKVERTITLQELENNAKESKAYLEEISRKFGLLDKKLNELEAIFKQARGEA